MKSLSRNVLTVLFSLFIWSHAFGWGSLAHRATGHIADAYLSPQAKTAVAQLLQGQTLADVAFWADTIKKDDALAHTYWYHFENVPDKTRFLDHVNKLPQPERQKGGVLEAILVSERTLEDPKANMQQKAFALRFLMHFIGDLHQPLHSGRPEDKGGNTIAVNWFGRPGNLHQIWDTGMIYSGHPELFENQAQNADYAALYARWLMGKYKGREADMMGPPTRDNPEAWLYESMVQRPLIYNRDFESNQPSYQSKGLPILDQRVYAAGLRAADVLNRIFARVNPPNTQVEFMKRLEQIVGRLSDFITVGPRGNTPPSGDRRRLVSF